MERATGPLPLRVCHLQRTPSLSMSNLAGKAEALGLGPLQFYSLKTVQ